MVRNLCRHRGSQAGRGNPARQGTLLAAGRRQHSGLVATTGALGEIEFLNRQTLEYFGKTTQELKDWALIGAVHPDDLPRVIEARKKSIELGQIYQVEHRCRRADGVYRWFQVRGLPVRDT